MIAITRGVSRSLGDCELTWLAREPIDIDRAIAQHREYEACLASLGARVISLPPLEEHPDAVFVEDPAIVLDEVAVITTMGAASRRGERASLAAALAEYRHGGLDAGPGSARRRGRDARRPGFVRRDFGTHGRGRRGGTAGTDRAVWVSGHGDGVAGLPAFEIGLLLYRGRFSENDTVLINRDWVNASALTGYRLIDVASDEPWAANALRVGAAVVMAAAFPKTADRLRRAGFEVRPVDVSELMKAESGVTCSSLILERTK